MSGVRIVVVLSGYPRRSETFAVHELIALQARGMLAAVFATKPGDGQPPQPDCAKLNGAVRYFPEMGVTDQAALIVDALKGHQIDGVHGYFAHRPTEVAQAVAQQLNIPFGFSTHARDARKVERSQLVDRARRAAGVIACNPDVAGAFEGMGASVHLIPHGVDTHRFASTPLPGTDPYRILAVGRLVEKKGFDVLIRAANRLSFDFQLSIIGSGPLHDRLDTMIQEYGLGNRVRLYGSKSHDELPQAYTKSHLVVVPSVIDRDGDRDGLPNVVLEAMASARPVVASRAGAIPSAVEHEHHGLIVEPGCETELAAAIEKLSRDPGLVDRLAVSARASVEQRWGLAACGDRFCRCVEEMYA